MVDSKYENYEENFIGEKPLLIANQKNLVFVISYLREVKKRSDQAYKTQKSVLKFFFNYIDKSINKIKLWDVINYFNEELNPKELKQKTKETHRSYIKSFFDHVIGLLAKKEIEFHNPVPNQKIYKFDKNERDIAKKSEKDKKKLSKNRLIQILDYIKKNTRQGKKKKAFLLLGLAMCTGARISEIRTIRIKNINLKERYFETGFEKNARKSTHHTNESLIFFFPKSIATYLENYIRILEEKSDIWLFPMASDHKRHISQTSAEYYCRKTRIGLGFHFTIHYFRHSFISHLKSNGCSRDDREMLLNHTRSGTQAKIYEHDDIFEMRTIYDKYFPYYDFPYF